MKTLWIPQSGAGCWDLKLFLPLSWGLRLSSAFLCVSAPISSFSLPFHLLIGTLPLS